jgi:predicted DNA-binding transcriptional regulator YafY
MAVLAQACRDRDEVRFDYRRRDGEETRRLVQPYQLVSADRRWYLVAWDKRRGDWRTFRVDRLSEPRLAGPRFAPRELPAADAAAFVEQSLQAAPLDHEAVVLVQVPAERLRAVARWFRADLEALDDESCRLRLRAESLPALAWMVTVLAVNGRIEIEPDAGGDLRELLAAIGGRLAGAV